MRPLTSLVYIGLELRGPSSLLEADDPSSPGAELRAVARGSVTTLFAVCLSGSGAGSLWKSGGVRRIRAKNESDSEFRAAFSPFGGL